MAEVSRLVLASGSRTRRDMLTAAGLAFEVMPADVDELVIRDGLLSRGITDPTAIAAALARAKSTEVSRRVPEALVIGADQVLALGERLFEKPRDLAEARANLLDLRGCTHVLCSAVALSSGGQVSWSTTSQARMTMRAFSCAFLDSYLARVGDRVCESVGAYQLEGLGLQLFESIDGDYFTILGMPLLPLLAELRSRGGIAT